MEWYLPVIWAALIGTADALYVIHAGSRTITKVILSTYAVAG